MSKQRVKVLQLQSKYAAGVNHVAEMISSALPSEQYEVTMAYLEGEGSSSSEQVKLFHFSKAQCSGVRREVKKELMKYCRQQQFDIVIGHRFKAISALMPVVRKLNSMRAIAVIHGVGDYDRWYRKVLVNYYLHRHWRVVAVSDYVRDYFLKSTAVRNRDLISVIPNAVDVSLLKENFFTREEARLEFGLSENDFVFGAHGRLATVKGYEYLLEAFAPLAKVNPRVKLLLIGDGPLMEQLQLSAKDLGVEQQVILPGYREGANRFLTALNVFVMPSYSEGLSIALLEAMSAGLPVLASDIPSVNFVLGETIELIPVGDKKTWSEYMNRYVDMCDRERSRYSAFSAMRVSNFFDVVFFRSSYLEIIK